METVQGSNNFTQNIIPPVNLKTLIDNGIIPDYVKIDGALLQKLSDGKESHEEKINIYRTIQILKAKGIQIIWEWIRHNRDGYFARKLWCTLFQWRDIDPSNFTLD